jgi:archaellum component FlaC
MIMDKSRYLDYYGLKKYDELVKKYISSVRDALSDNIDDKVNEIKERISDLDTIRSNANKGATALQEEDLGFVTDGDIDGIFK